METQAKNIQRRTTSSWVHVLVVFSLTIGPAFAIAVVAFVGWVVGWTLTGGGSGGATGDSSILAHSLYVVVVLAIVGVCGTAAVSGLASLILLKKTRWSLAYWIPMAANIVLAMGLSTLAGRVADAGKPSDCHVDASLLRERVEQYYRQNGDSLDAGGSQLRFGQPNGVTVKDSLSVADLVDPSELKQPIANYTLEIDRSSEHYFDVILLCESGGRQGLGFLKRQDRIVGPDGPRD